MRSIIIFFLEYKNTVEINVIYIFYDFILLFWFNAAVSFRLNLQYKK